jgi:uncharacterized protein (TIGR00725 family)
MRRLICTIVGCKETSAKWGQELEKRAEEAGAMAASVGFAVLTGGRTGVMAAAARGAKEAGGVTLAILPENEHLFANPWIDFVMPSGMGIGRNFLTALAGDVMLALPGGTGTLEEMCFAADFNRPVLAWSSWEDVDLPVDRARRGEKDRVVKWLAEQYTRLYQKEAGR